MKNSDQWTQDGFEDYVASSIIALYENKILNNTGAGPNKLRENHVTDIRKSGVFIPSKDRIVIAPGDDGKWEFDVMNDPLPIKGNIAIKRDNKKEGEEGKYFGYLQIFAFERIHHKPKRWFRRSGGDAYKITFINAVNQGLEGEVFYVSIDRDGAIHAFDEIVSGKGLAAMGVPMELTKSIVEPEFFSQAEAISSSAFQYHADKRFCWSITAEEQQAKATLGCMKEEVKSLLYARSLPLSSTGRKRPILHLVEAHKRRLKNGTDIDISDFLRGVQKVEMGGTLFTVNAPSVLKKSLSNNRQ
jgi:hypothetical protein